jgi:hypothetical protein
MWAWKEWKEWNEWNEWNEWKVKDGEGVWVMVRVRV